MVDAYDVMTNGSSYKEAISHEEALRNYNVVLEPNLTLILSRYFVN